ncbi:MAG: endonuclease/exonuclease/phosphatase family protein [Cyclobacteriaceae bacterium]
MNSEVIVSTLSILLTAATIASLIKWDNWWIRVFDFPRLQITTLIILNLGISALAYDFVTRWDYVLVGLLLLSFIYQSYKILPYTPFWKKQVRRHKGNDHSRAISIMVSNVLTPNKKAQKLVERVKQVKPQILLTLETDQWWEDQLKDLEADYPHRVQMPLDNLYGMHLYSKLELIEYEIKFLIQEDIPSIEALVKLPSGDAIRIYCLHPMPPSPTESDTSTNRDAEILLVGKTLTKQKEPVLVFGDLNDVAWSNTTRLFQQISGLLDPRIGRGFFSTFHAKYPLFRWPLDHVFHSHHFELISYRRLKSIGSDHFPIFTKLYLQPHQTAKPEIPQADEEDKQEVTEKIEKGNPIREVVESA